MQVPPPEAAAAFGDRLALAMRYADLLDSLGQQWGLIGPRETERLWTRHLLNSVAPGPLIPIGARVVDVGSGAGLPGIPLAIARPDLAVTLIEPMARRTRFLEHCRAVLALPDLTVLRARAEELAGRVLAPVVITRALAPLDRLLGWCWPLVEPHGVLLAIKGDAARVELDRVGAALPADLAGAPEVLRCGPDSSAPLATVVRLRRGPGRGSGGRRGLEGGGTWLAGPTGPA